MGMDAPFYGGANMNRTVVFFVAVATSLAALTFGIWAAVVWRGELPAWLLASVLSLLLCAALAFGFTNVRPSLPPWARSRPVIGALLVTGGVAAVYIPAQFVVAAALIGAGVRVVWVAARDLERQDTLAAKDAAQDSVVIERRRATAPLAVRLGQSAARGIRRMRAGRQLPPKS
jgi:hypothetical protein